ncbi:MAG TPA: hypothetical protein VJ508_18495, partial [Saprospiraceae bacterium]|nr:hypothetical protein [Saprospiraceae bacterium]
MIPFNRIGLFLCLCWSGILHALPDISMEVFRYQSANGPYIEVSLYVAGPSMKCDSISKGAYGIGYVLMVSDSAGHIVAGNRYKLSAFGYPAKDIMDVKRFAVPPGHYKIALEARDILDSLDVVTASQDIDIPSDASKVYLSDVSLHSTIAAVTNQPEEWVKSGLYLEPLPFRL